MIRVGYQGIEGSNSEEAAKQLLRELQISEYKLIPLVTSKGVIDSLTSKEIDYGVVAIRNSLGGFVSETCNALKESKVEQVNDVVIQIHQCLFCLPNKDRKDIEYIASHPQALFQTRNNRLKYFPNALEKVVEDTALAAKYLLEERLPSTAGVLCTKRAGEFYGLKLLYENMEDRVDNFTEFKMFKLKVNEELL